MKAHGSLRKRILAILAIAVIVPTVLFAGLASWRARSDLEREVVRGNLALIRSLGDSLDRTLQGARSSVAVGAAAWADQADSPDAERNGRRLLRRIRREVPLISSLAVIDLEGRIVAGDPMEIPADLGAHSFGGYIGDVVFEDGRPTVRLVMQARNRTGEWVGSLVAKLDLAFITQALSDARLGKGAHLLVVDGGGIPVARTGDPSPIKRTSVRDRNTAVDRALGQAAEGSMSADGQVVVYRNLSGFESLRGVRWAILLSQPERDAYALARATRRDSLLIGGGVLLVLLTIGAVLANRITRPLRRLAERADQVAGSSTSATPIPAVGGPGEIGLLSARLEDMAERIREREDLQSALARGDRLATVGTMAASVAHEVNNPLTTVLGYANLLLEDKEEGHPDRQGLELIASEANRMQKIVGNLLDYTRGQHQSSGRTADLNEILGHTADLLRPAARKARVELRLNLGDDLGLCAADGDALQQVFVNLVQNAIQAMADGGQVDITSTIGPGKGNLVVTVVDGGDGIAEEERTQVFESFYTTKRRGAGTGLGLAVCRHLVTGFRGSIEVADAPAGRGACFRVRIPRATV